MEAFKDIKVTIKEEKDNYGLFEISPLPRGYGNTLGNALRRILYSSLRGSGITGVNIKGVDHEYSTIDGVKENVLDIILNLKQVKFQTKMDDVFTCKLNVKGKKTVCAGDIEVTGDLEVVNGNFLHATQLVGGSLQRGNNLLYTINDGGQLFSQSNTISSSSSGIEGLTVSVTDAGADGNPAEVTITVSSDTEAVKTAIEKFITDYNSTQSLLDTLTANTTDEKGKVSAGMFASDWDVNQIASTLRNKAYGEIEGLDTTLTSLAKIGITTSGYDNSLTLDDSDLLDEYLENNLNDLKQLFTDETNGLATRLNTYLEQLTDEDDGTLSERQSTLAKQSSAIDTQIEDLERIVQANRQMLVNNFVSMESARSNINQQLQFLQKNLGV